MDGGAGGGLMWVKRAGADVRQANSGGPDTTAVDSCS